MQKSGAKPRLSSAGPARWSRGEPASSGGLRECQATCLALDREVHTTPLAQAGGVWESISSRWCLCLQAFGPSSPARAAKFKAGWNLGMVRKELTDSRCAGVWSAAASPEHRLHHLPRRLGAVAAEGTSCSLPQGTGARPGTGGHRPDRLLMSQNQAEAIFWEKNNVRPVFFFPFESKSQLLSRKLHKQAGF